LPFFLAVQGNTLDHIFKLGVSNPFCRKRIFYRGLCQVIKILGGKKERIRKKSDSRLRANDNKKQGGGNPAPDMEGYVKVFLLYYFHSPAEGGCDG